MRKENEWNDVELRDGRYNQVIHMVSAAKGAEDFYDNQHHVTRHEGIDLARQLDDLTAQVWTVFFHRWFFTLQSVTLLLLCVLNFGWIWGIYLH